jgi:hypothetical protein
VREIESPLGLTRIETVCVWADPLGEPARSVLQSIFRIGRLRMPFAMRDKMSGREFSAWGRRGFFEIVRMPPRRRFVSEICGAEQIFRFDM